MELLFQFHERISILPILALNWKFYLRHVSIWHCRCRPALLEMWVSHYSLVFGGGGDAAVVVAV